MHYRPDIDGLRAVAVLSVIVYHVNPALVPAGFVGVDIFFVISGYLISLQIFKDIQAGRFSILEFYRRRIKRIAPAMLVVLGVTLAFAQIMLRPEDAEEVARSAFWSLLSLANAHFWLADDGSYFAGPSDELPLLHFWSLAVEEQFYMIWPLVLMLCGSRIASRPFFAVAIVVAVLSFLFGQYYFSVDPSFVYYMLPARAGELLIGALAAWWIHARGALRISRMWNDILATAGIALVAGALFLVSADDPFPGFAALAPTLGTAALILSGGAGRTWATQLLTLRPMTWVGLVSYSAYLWHWPILAFLRYAGVTISAPVGAAVVISTLTLAWLSYAYVETPLRKTRQGVLAVLTKMYLLPAGALGILAVASLKTDGEVFHRFYPGYIAQLEQTRLSLQPTFGLDFVCQHPRISTEDIENSNCVVGPPELPISVILWGDSNASHYIGMLTEFGKESGFRFRNVETGACPPLYGDPTPFVVPRRKDDCAASNRLIWPYLMDYKTVVISASWAVYQERSVDFLDEFEATVDRLADAGINVVLLGKAPVFDGYDRLCSEKALRFGFMDCSTAPIPLNPDVAAANKQLRSIAQQRQSVAYFDANDYLCPNGLCTVEDENGTVRYYDRSHLTYDASRQLGRSIAGTAGVPEVFLEL